MSNINIFVSSTCYDLSQIRTDISEFIENSGHNSILSEFENFPISPELNTIENCIKIVKENADILVLIVGNRYGSIIENGKSITNNEFLVAKQKGIPIFCFIDKSTLNALNFWQNNKNSNFSNIVDNVQIFEFIEDIRNNNKIWTFPFEKAQDIIRTLKIQLSYLFKNSLKARKILDNDVSELFKMKLSNTALRIMLEKNDIYELRFLAQIFVDEINKIEFLRNDIEYSILVDPKHIIHNNEDIPNWVNERITSSMNIIASLKNIVNIALPKFLGEPGTSADLKGLYYVAVKYAELYEQLLNWVIVTRSTFIDDEFESLKINLSKLTIKAADQIWDFPFDLHQKINVVYQKIIIGEPVDNIILRITVDIDEGVLADIYLGLDEYRNHYGI